MVQIVLLAGPSGSGKSRVARLTGCPQVALDDFYREGDDSSLPYRADLGVVDWDDVRSWDLEAALSALQALVEHGWVDVPIYSIADNARVGWHRLEIGGAPVVVAEGIFAPDLVGPCRDADLPVTAIWLDRPRTLTAILRFIRDVREGRKPVWVLLRRGFALWRSEPALRRRALELDCRPLSLRATCELIMDLAWRPSSSPNTRSP